MAVWIVDAVSLSKEDDRPRVMASGGVSAQLLQIPCAGMPESVVRHIVSVARAAFPLHTDEVEHIAVGVAGELLARERAREKAAPAASADDKPKTGRELIESLEKMGFVGMWAERTDIEDSSEYASELREQAWTRHSDT
jgi:hypothetical protein